MKNVLKTFNNVGHKKKMKKTTQNINTYTYLNT